MESRRDIEFRAADGVNLRGLLYSAGESRACIIMSNGVSRPVGHYPFPRSHANAREVDSSLEQKRHS